MSRPLLVMPCSARKSPAPGLIPARERYTGPAWRTLHANAGELALEVIVLSAAHGFIYAETPIATYDRKLDDRRADELMFDISAPWAREKALAAPQVFLMGSYAYRAVMMEVLFSGTRAILDPARVWWPHDRGERLPGIGEQVSDLKAWLNSIREAAQC